MLFLVNSPPSTTTLRFPHSSSINISLGKSTKFLRPYMTVPFSSSSTITILSEGLSSYSMKTWFSFKIKREHIIICERNFLHFISYYIPFSYYLFISYISFFSSFRKFVSKVFSICLASIIGWMETGEFTFILNTDCWRNSWTSFSHFCKSRH